MPLKSIIIDNQTKAQRIAPDKVQLDLVAFPLDENNDTEPNVDLRLHINGELFQNFISEADGCVRKSIIIDDSDHESITVNLEDIVQGIQSKIKCVMIGISSEETFQKQEKRYEKIYNLNKSIISEFKEIEKYFQIIMKPGNGYDTTFIDQEFEKINHLVTLKHQIKKAERLEFYEDYKEQIEKIVNYCKSHMTTKEISLMMKDIEEIIAYHDQNRNQLRRNKKLKEIEEKSRTISREERERVSAQVGQNPGTFPHIEQKFRKDKEIAMIAIAQDTLRFRYADDILKTNEDFVVECIERFGIDKMERHLSSYTKNLPRVKAKIDNLNQKKREDAKIKQEKKNNITQQINNIMAQREVLIKEKNRIANDLRRIDVLKLEIESNQREIYNCEIAIKDMEKVHSLRLMYNGKTNVNYNIGDQKEMDRLSTNYGNPLVNRYAIYNDSQKKMISEYKRHQEERKQGLEQSVQKNLKEIDKINTEIGYKNEKNINDLDQEINQLWTKITNLTKEKNAI